MIHHLHPLPTELYSLICTVLWKADPYLGLHLAAPFSVFSWVWPVTGIGKGLRGGSRRGWDIFSAAASLLLCLCLSVTSFSNTIAPASNLSPLLHHWLGSSAAWPSSCPIRSEGGDSPCCRRYLGASTSLSPAPPLSPHPLGNASRISLLLCATISPAKNVVKMAFCWLPTVYLGLCTHFSHLILT